MNTYYSQRTIQTMNQKSSILIPDTAPQMSTISAGIGYYSCCDMCKLISSLKEVIHKSSKCNGIASPVWVPVLSCMLMQESTNCNVHPTDNTTCWDNPLCPFFKTSVVFVLWGGFSRLGRYLRHMDPNAYLSISKPAPHCATVSTIC